MLGGCSHPVCGNAGQSGVATLGCRNKIIFNLICKYSGEKMSHPVLQTRDVSHAGCSCCVSAQHCAANQETKMRRSGLGNEDG